MKALFVLVLVFVFSTVRTALRQTKTKTKNLRLGRFFVCLSAVLTAEKTKAKTGRDLFAGRKQSRRTLCRIGFQPVQAFVA